MTITIENKQYQTEQLPDGKWTLPEEIRDMLKCCCGALDIDGNRVGTKTEIHSNGKRSMYGGNSLIESKTHNNISEEKNYGRYPAQCFVNELAAQNLDKQSGVKTSGAMKSNHNVGKTGEDGYMPHHGIYGKYKARPFQKEVEASEGGCSKILAKCDFEKDEHDLYFYNPKVSKKERNAGCEDMEGGQCVGGGGGIGDYLDDVNSASGKFGSEKAPAKNTNPCLKPISLNKRILSLFKTPNPQTIIYPFAGSGSEVIGGLKAGFIDWSGCEINPEYCDIAEARIKYWTNKFKEDNKQSKLI